MRQTLLKFAQIADCGIRETFRLRLSWHGTWFQRFHVPNMFRTSCSEHRVPNIVFRRCSEHVPNVQDCYFHPKNPYKMPLRPQKMRNSAFSKKCLHFSFSKTRILKIVISTISMRPKIQIPRIHDNLGACSEHVPNIWFGTVFGAN